MHVFNLNPLFIYPSLSFLVILAMFCVRVDTLSVAIMNLVKSLILINGELQLNYKR
jgi:hypothetical protein